jgi:two-component system alkaline phosphatase synthesis response regulator PhoP
MAEKKKILVIEDEEETVGAMKFVLGKGGYQVVSAANGVEGMEKARAEQPDLIILDLIMPEKDGYKVHKELKADLGLKGIPIIVLSAIMDHFRGSRFKDSVTLGLKGDRFMAKPVSAEELLNAVQEMLA